MRTDAHVHCNLSSDSKASPREMIEAGIENGLEIICFTDHYDKDNYEWGDENIFNPQEYFETLKPLVEEYREKIDVRIGVELGLGRHLGSYYKDFTQKYPFDFVLGSVHCLGASDIAKRRIFRNWSDEEVYHMTFQETLEDITRCEDFDVLGHLDYVVRYGANKEDEYVYEKYADEIDAILKKLIEMGKGLEVNMAGMRYGLSFPNPHQKVLSRYRELGGEIITVGSDAHAPEHVAWKFYLAPELLWQCGFKYYTEFIGRKAYFLKLL